MVSGRDDMIGSVISETPAAAAVWRMDLRAIEQGGGCGLGE